MASVLLPPLTVLLRLYHAALGLSWVAIALPLLVWGAPYYATPLAERPHDPAHALFSPTGLVGNRLGIAGTAMLAFGVGMYAVRKRWRALHGLGKLRHWLSFHIWLCTLGPFLILLHTSFKVGGLVSIAFWSMVLVVSSGVLGRYVYVHIPKTLNGHFRTQTEIAEQQAALLDALSADGRLSDDDRTALALGAPPPRATRLAEALAMAPRIGFEGWRRERGLAARLAERGVPAADRRRLVAWAREYRRLNQGRAVLEPFARLFRYWHAVHLPLALVMLLIVLVHVGVAFAFGYAWTPA